MGKGTKQNGEIEDRIDKKHRFPLRIDPALFNECEAYSFRQNTSLNLLFSEMISYCMDSQGFRSRFEEKYKRDERKGHFAFIANENTLRRGRML